MNIIANKCTRNDKMRQLPSCYTYSKNGSMLIASIPNTKMIKNGC